MSNIKNAYLNAILADATYALDDTTLDETSTGALTAALTNRMTPALARAIER